MMVTAFAGSAQADELLYRYEGDVLPYDPSAGWAVYNACEQPCAESIRDGAYRLEWARASDDANYHFKVAALGERYPMTLWVEWHFRSNHHIGRFFYSCDAWFTVFYAHAFVFVFIYGDAVISSGGDSAVVGLANDVFHTYRYENLDGVHYRISVDGRVFVTGSGGYTPRTFLQFGGQGGCISDQFPNMHNEWDFVRFGTIGFGERVVASDPPAGFLDPDRYADLDRFTVTFDSPNYVYVVEIGVDVRGMEPRSDEGEATEVRATKAGARTRHEGTEGEKSKSQQGEKAKEQATKARRHEGTEGIQSTIGNRQSTIHHSEFSIPHSTRRASSPRGGWTTGRRRWWRSSWTGRCRWAPARGFFSTTA
jgi:hypothetical protein